MKRLWACCSSALCRCLEAPSEFLGRRWSCLLEAVSGCQGPWRHGTWINKCNWCPVHMIRAGDLDQV